MLLRRGTYLQCIASHPTHRGMQTAVGGRADAVALLEQTIEPAQATEIKPSCNDHDVVVGVAELPSRMRQA